MKMVLRFIIYTCLLMACLAMRGHEKKICFKKKIYACKKSVTPKKAIVPQSDTYITIWVHGVSLLKPNTYNLGLWPAFTFVENRHLFEVIKELVEADPLRFPEDNVFVYSWEGKFDYAICEAATKRFYNELTKTIANFTAQNKCRPKIRIITFSYGGNIVFGLPKYKKPNDNIAIDELIVLAWPVQQNYAAAANNPMFKKIFNVYSPLDIVQIIDPQGCCARHGCSPLFSSRRLKKASHILQAQVLVNGRACGHFGLSNRQFLSAFPTILDALNDWFSYAQDHNLALKRVRYILSIYTDPTKARKHRVRCQMSK